MVAFKLTPDRYFDPGKPEMIDRNDNEPAILRDDLANLRTINRYFGGLSAVTSQIGRFFDKAQPGHVMRILDLATGSGDHPVALSQWAAKAGKQIHITAVDKNPAILTAATEYAVGFGNIDFAQMDILNLDYPENHFDVVLCSLALHHLAEADAVSVLRTMSCLSRIGFVVNDLNRTWYGALATLVYSYVSTSNPMTRHDSYLSVLRGFTPLELQRMAKLAGLTHFRILNRPMFRLILIGEH